MGSLKDEMRGLREDHPPCEKTDDERCPGGSDSSAAPEAPRLYTSQESPTQGDYQEKLHMNASSVEAGDKNPISKDEEHSVVDCDSTDQPDSEQDCTLTDAMPLTQQPEADETTAATHNDATISIKFLSDEDGDAENQGERLEEENLDQDRGTDADIESVFIPVPATPGPSDPCSPAPFGQHHMRTQVSLEVVQCHSAATSPMTPPEGDNSFFFPSSLGKAGGVGSDTKDAELQVGHQVEFCSVATSPMTPKTPFFPDVIGRETPQMKDRVKASEEPWENGQKESFPATKSPPEDESEITEALKSTTSKELTEGFGSNVSPEGSTNCLTAGLKDSQVTLEDSHQQCKQQRMGSMDQDITILVTHHDNFEEEEEDKAASSSSPSIEPEMVRIDEQEEANDSSVKMEDDKETVAPDHVQDTSNQQHNKTEETSAPPGERPKTSTESENSEAKENKESRDVSTSKPPVPESPAPFGCHNIRTQVSLEVVQCQSAATSPMTPPEGDHAFHFPSSFGKCGSVGTETKDAEMQVGQQVEFRSVATAPMTPRTPTAPTFPEVRKVTSIEEKIVEEDENKTEQVEEEDEEEEEEEEASKEEDEKVTEEKTAEEDKKEEMNCKGEEKCEEPVQEVSWDEKGMTWEVYGAVVEVAVLGSAIQKHLEKQVKKQKRQSTMPPPPPLNPSATALTSEASQGGSGSGKGRMGKRGEQDGKVGRRRRNPFRQLMENMQQPHCCSRAHTTE